MLNTYLVAAGFVMGERVLEVVFGSVSDAGTLSVSTMLERCPASGEVGK
jgi:hypothetical protein